MSEQIHSSNETTASGGEAAKACSSAAFTPHDCAVCLCTIEDLDEATSDCVNNFCAECGPNVYQHKSCLANCAKSYINSSFVGSIKNIVCAKEHPGKKTQIKYSAWSRLVDASTIEKYNKLHLVELNFLCGNCHTSKSQLVPFIETKTLEMLEKELKDILVDKESFFKSLELYVAGSLEVFEFHRLITKVYCPKLRDMEDFQVWTYMKAILETVEDVAKRSQLEIRHLKTRPKFQTLCCQRVHCFNCKTKDFHDGKTCVDNTATLDSTVLACPSCQIYLVKSEGCSSVTCLACNFRFDWSEQLQKYKYQVLFVQVYVNNPIQSCAQILLGILIPDGNDQNPAFQYRNLNDALVDREIVKVWSEKYPLCAAAATYFDNNSLSVNRKIHSQAFQILRTKFEKEYNRLSSNFSNFKSNKTFLKAVYTSDDEILKAIDAFQKAGNEVHNLGSSLLEWKTANLFEYRDFVRNRTLNGLQQYLLMHGNQKFTNAVKPIYYNMSFAKPHTWSTDVKGSLSNRTKFCLANGPEDLIEVVVGKFFFRNFEKSNSRKLSFGLVHASNSTNLESTYDSFAQISGTYGVVFLMESGRLIGKLYAGSSTCVGHWLGMKDGDLLTCYINKNANYCEMSLNYTEFHRFELPNLPQGGAAAPLCANGHQLRLSTFLVNDVVVTCNGSSELMGCVCKKSLPLSSSSSSSSASSSSSSSTPSSSSSSSGFANAIDPSKNFSWRCESCDYDLCTPCYNHRSTNKREYAFVMNLHSDEQQIRLPNMRSNEGIRHCSPTEAKQHFRVTHLLKNLITLPADLSTCPEAYRKDVIDRYNQMWLDKYEGKADIPNGFREMLRAALMQNSLVSLDFSWDFVVCALSRVLFQDFAKEMSDYATMASELLKSHRKSDAPFYSAYCLAEEPIDATSSQDKAQEREKQLKRQRLATAFMRSYPAEAESFYKSPCVAAIMKPISTQCRCLPRHSRSEDHICPYSLVLNL